MPESERDLASAFEDWLDLRGYRWCHFRPARTLHGYRTALSGAKGWPDYAICRAERFLVAELKGDKGKLSAEQEAWRDALVMAGVEYHLFRPSDWDSITSILR